VVGNLESTFHKEKFRNMFHGAFVSARAAQVINSEVFDGLLRGDALIAIENTKYLVPFTKTERDTINAKIDEFANSRQWNKLASTSVYTCILCRDACVITDNAVFL
jgi:hypothetical protein